MINSSCRAARLLCFSRDAYGVRRGDIGSGLMLSAPLLAEHARGFRYPRLDLHGRRRGADIRWPSLSVAHGPSLRVG